METVDWRLDRRQETGDGIREKEVRRRDRRPETGDMRDET